MPIAYRPAREEDLQRAGELVVGSINDLCVRHGFSPIATVRPPSFSLFFLRDDPQGLWVAQEAGETLGFGFSWVCDDLWYLAQLFVAPGQQAHGIGGELIERTLRQAQTSKAATRALITFAFNTTSQGLYMRHGMFPRCPLYNVRIAREDLMGRLHGAPLRCAPIENTAAHLESLTKIDTRVLGISRRTHHQCLLSEGPARGAMMYADDSDECIAYAYIVDGHIGPLAVARPALVGAAFRTALGIASQGGSAHVSALLPGPCETALGIAVELGMRITIPMILMSSREFGDWSRYLPRNAGFM